MPNSNITENTIAEATYRYGQNLLSSAVVRAIKVLANFADVPETAIHMQYSEGNVSDQF